MLRLGYVFAAMAAITALLLPFQWLAVKLGLPLRRRIPGLFHRMMCAILGVRVRVIGRRMLVGLLARLQRSVFVDRARRHKTHRVNAEIAQRLAEGDPVVLFGEGTSSDGNRVLPFRSALVGSARDALADAGHTGRVWIQPLSIAYTGLQGLPLCRRDRPRVAWYGDLTMGPHFAGMARHGAIDATVTWGEPIAFDEQSDRKAITRLLEAEVRRRTVLALRGGGVPGPR